MREGIDEPQPIESLPGVVQHSQDSLRAEVERLAGLGIPAVILRPFNNYGACQHLEKVIPR